MSQMISRANLYRVPKSQWEKWDTRSRQTFNLVYSTMRSNQGIFSHPKATHQSRVHWQTVAWNAAWMGADACNDPVQAVEDMDARTEHPCSR